VRGSQWDAIGQTNVYVRNCGGAYKKGIIGHIKKRGMNRGRGSSGKGVKEVKKSGLG